MTAQKKQVMRRVFLLATAGIVFLINIFGNRYRFGVDSDNAFYSRAANAILEGNLGLSGWYGGYYSNFTSDFLWTVILKALGCSEKIVQNVYGPFVMMIVLLLSICIIRHEDDDKISPISLLCLLPIAFLPKSLQQSMLTVGMHVLSILYLALFCVIFKWLVHSGLTIVKGILWFLVIVLLGGNDEWPVFFFVLPACLVLAIDLFQKFSIQKFFLLFIMLSGIAAERGLKIVLSNLDTIRLTEYTTNFIDLRGLFDYLAAFIISFLGLFQADFSGSSLFSVHTFICGVGILFAGMLLFFLLRAFIRWNGTDLLTRVMAVGAFFSVGVYLFDNINKGTQWTVLYHYLSPFYFLSVWVLARSSKKLRFSQRKKMFVFILPMLLFSAFNFPTHYYRSPQNTERLTKISEYLDEHNVSHAYASYWESHAVWYYSQGRVASAPVFQNMGKLRPYLWATNSEWYLPSYNANCLIITDGQGPTESEIVAEFGRPISHETVDTAQIYIFENNISEIVYENRQFE